MKLPVFATTVCVLCVSIPSLAAAQAPRQPQTSQSATSRAAQAYEQFILGHHLEENDDIPGAIAAFNKAIELNPTSAEIRSELAGVFLRHDRIDDAVRTAEEALKIDADSREAHRVLGIVAAAQVETRTGQPRGAAADATLANAIKHLEQAIANPLGEADPNVRATLSRLYLRAANYDKAIPLLVDLVRQQPGWQDGPLLLAQAYSASGRTREGSDWLAQQTENDPRLLPTLADFYERDARWKEAADAYAKAVEIAPRNVDLQTRYAQALLNVGGRDNIVKARDALGGVVSVRVNDVRALYLLSQAYRRSGDPAGAEAAARRVITLQDASPWGYFALAEALEARRQWDAVVTALTPAVEKFRGMAGDHTNELGMLLPHLGFAHQELGRLDLAVSTFEEAHRLSPKDVAVTGYLVEANISAKKYAAAADLAREARVDAPNDFRLARLQAQAMRLDGKTDQAVSLLEEAFKSHADDATAYLGLAQLYADAARGPQAVTLLQEAVSKFPENDSISFQLGAVFDKQKRFADAETAFRRVLTRDPDNAPALNYLGYMLADRGERLDESVDMLKRAVQADPDNGSYLDSLGWAYFKAGQFDLAEDNLKRAAEQLRTNSVIQDHYGDLLAKRARYGDAVTQWERALAGDSDSIDRADITKKIRDARPKINRR